MSDISFFHVLLEANNTSNLKLRSLQITRHPDYFTNEAKFTCEHLLIFVLLWPWQTLSTFL